MYSGEKMDVWSLGVILYNMLYAKAPFFGKTHQDMFEKILNGRVQFPEDRPISKGMISFTFSFLTFPSFSLPSSSHSYCLSKYSPLILYFTLAFSCTRACKYYVRSQLLIHYHSGKESHVRDAPSRLREAPPREHPLETPLDYLRRA